jgi:hypothetical protein
MKPARRAQEPSGAAFLAVRESSGTCQQSHNFLRASLERVRYGNAALQLHFVRAFLMDEFLSAWSPSASSTRQNRSPGELIWGWRFLLVFSVFVTNVIVAIVAWYAVGALLR